MAGTATSHLGAREKYTRVALRVSQRTISQPAGLLPKKLHQILRTALPTDKNNKGQL
jgi:hypothetical protein